MRISHTGDLLVMKEKYCFLLKTHVSSSHQHKWSLSNWESQLWRNLWFAKPQWLSKLCDELFYEAWESNNFMKLMLLSDTLYRIWNLLNDHKSWTAFIHIRPYCLIDSVRISIFSSRIYLDTSWFYYWKTNMNKWCSAFAVIQHIQKSYLVSHSSTSLIKLLDSQVS